MAELPLHTFIYKSLVKKILVMFYTVSIETTKAPKKGFQPQVNKNMKSKQTFLMICFDANFFLNIMHEWLESGKFGFLMNLRPGNEI